MKRLFLINLVAALVLLIVACSNGGQPTISPSPTATRPPGLEIGYPAPDFSLTSYDGKKVTLSELKGKPVFLNFWSTT